MRALLGGLIVGLSLWALPVQAQVSRGQVEALVEALRQAAPQPASEKDGVYSEWQVLPGNIPRWSKACIGRELTPTQFEASPATARNIVTCVMEDVLKEEYQASNNSEPIAVLRSASWWMTGDPSRYNSTQTGPYAQRVLSLYQKLRGNPSTSGSSSRNAAQPVSQAAAPSGSQSLEYNRYMQAGYNATQKNDYASALLNFKRALDERPDDTYAIQAIRNVEGYLARDRAAANQSNSTGSTTTANSTASNSTPTATTPTATTGTASNTAITQAQAIALIERWLQAKQRIFAPPFDQAPVTELTTGELYASLTRSDGAIAWLKDNQAYYRFGVQKVESVERFAAGRNKATVEVRVTEDRTLYRNGTIDPSQTEFDTDLIRYSLEIVDGQWKIADYKTVDGSVLERSVNDNAERR